MFISHEYGHLYSTTVVLLAASTSYYKYYAVHATDSTLLLVPEGT